MAKIVNQPLQNLSNLIIVSLGAFGAIILIANSHHAMGCNREPTQEEAQRIHDAASRIASEVGADSSRAEQYIRMYGELGARSKLLDERRTQLTSSTFDSDFDRPRSFFDEEMEVRKFETTHESDPGPGFHEVSEPRLRQDDNAKFLEKAGFAPEDSRLEAEPWIQHSKELETSLESAGEPRPGPMYEAAHIVPSGHRNKHAVRARSLLREADIYINSKENGFWAPTRKTKNSQGRVLEGTEMHVYGDEALTMHSETHTKEFFKDIAGRLEAVHPEDRSDVLATLRNELISGTWRPKY